MPLTGNFAALEKMTQGLAKLSSPSTVVKVAFATQEVLVTEVRLAMRGERTPYGEPFAPLKRDRTRNKKAAKKSGMSSKGKILRDTGRLANSIVGSIDGARAMVGTNAKYGAFHQYGTRKMVSRQFLFTPVQGLSEAAAGEVATVGRQVMMRTAPFILGAAK